MKVEMAKNTKYDKIPQRIPYSNAIQMQEPEKPNILIHPTAPIQLGVNEDCIAETSPPIFLATLRVVL